MADILSTLRELRSLEERRAHGTLSPEEEARFHELQAAVSSRTPASRPAPSPPQPPSHPPPPAPAAPALASSAPEQAAEPPFVDADLTEDATEVKPEPVAEGVQAAPNPFDAPGSAAPESVAAEPTLVQAVSPADLAASAGVPAPEESGTAAEKVVPMSAAELRQWTATFTPPAQPPPAHEAPAEATAANDALPEIPNADVEEPTTIAAAPPELSMPSVSEWLAATPVPDAGEAGTADDDAPMVWTDPEATRASEPPAASAANGAEPPPLLDSNEAAADTEPTRLSLAASSMDPTLADAFEPPPDQAASAPADVTSKRMTPIGEAFAAGESRVVVHTLGGMQKRGSLVDAHMNADFLELRLPDGEREMLSTAGLKAVFFVVPIGQEVPAPVGDPVTVTLADGHQLTGLSPDYQVGAVGFFLCPTDQRSRTAKIYIYAGAVKGIS